MENIEKLLKLLLAFLIMILPIIVVKDCIVTANEQRTIQICIEKGNSVSKCKELIKE